MRQGTITSHSVPKIHLPLKHKLPTPVPADVNEDEELISDEEEIQVIGSGMAEISNPGVVQNVEPVCDDVMEIVQAQPKTEISKYLKKILSSWAIPHSQIFSAINDDDDIEIISDTRHASESRNKRWRKK